MKAVIIIPARYDSTRFPGKPLVPLSGAGGVARSLLERAVMAGQATGLPVHVATDDSRIAAEAARIGVPAILTATTCRNGTERVAEAALRAGITAEVIINLQGDSPLIPPEFVQELLSAMQADPGIAMATPALVAGPNAVAALLADRRAGRVGGTTVVCDAQGDALYFSKEVLPFGAQGGAAVLHHVGLYAYRPDALRRYTEWPQGVLELAEGLEQLRFLENACPVRVVQVASAQTEFWEVNNPPDVAIVERALRRLGMG